MSEANIYRKLRNGGLSETAACAMMGNWYMESALKSNNVEDRCTLSDEEYTSAVDDGRISEYQFQADAFGYGLSQWTYPSRKQELWLFAKQKSVSVSDEDMQVEFALKEMKRDYSGLYGYLCSTSDLYAATSRICSEYENPRVKNVQERYEMAKKYYNGRGSLKEDETGCETAQNGDSGTSDAQVEKYTLEAENIAKDDSHGYSQQNRTGNPDYDCSSLVCRVVQNAGIPVMTKGASYTGNMHSAFAACGFRDVNAQVDMTTGSGMKRGDILLNVTKHTAIYIGNGQLVHARGADGHPEAGDQTGNEICIQGYWNYPWDYVMRYGSGSGGSNTAGNNKYYPEIIKYGDIGEEVRELQEKLNALGYSCGKADGEFGDMTLSALKKFQSENGLESDGEAGPLTFERLNSGAETPEAGDTEAAVGDEVLFFGNKHYLTANFPVGFSCKGGKAKITGISEKSKHPYHLVKLPDSDSTVHGWVDKEYVKRQ